MNRLEHIDIAKGIGIILVIVAHVLSGYGSTLIFTFHMPLFFLISGMVFRPKPAGVYAWEKSLHLLLPYAVFLLFFILIAPSPQLITLLDRADYSHPYLVALFGGQHLVTYTMTFWFVTCLFLTQQIFNWLANHLSRTPLLFLVGIGYILSLLDAAYLHIPWPWGINICLASLPFFAIGYYTRPLFHNGRGIITTLVVFLACAWAVSRYGYAVAYNMKYTHYGFPFISIVFALAGSKLVLELSSRLSRVRVLSSPLKWCGSASLVIMFLGQWYIYLVGDTRFWECRTLKIAMGIGIPLAIYWIASRFRFCRVILLGNYKEFPALLKTLRLK